MIHNRTYSRIGIFFIIAIPLIELGSLLFPWIGKIGTIMWIGMWFYITIYAIYALIEIIKESIHHKTPFTILAIAICIFLIVTNIRSMYSVNGENTQEISCALSHLQHAPDLGYRQTCLFGYPARQYIIPALPSMLWGRSLLTLNIGGAIYFILTIIIFLHGVRIYIQDHRKADAITFLLSGAFLHFYYVNHFLFLFEQSIFPLCFALAGCGLWLTYIRTKNTISLAPFTLVLYATIFAYTPGLALLPIAIGALLIVIVKNKATWFRVRTIGIITLSITMLALSVTFREDLEVGTRYLGGLGYFLTDLQRAITHLLFHTYPTPYTTWLFTPIFFLMILLPLMGIFGRTMQLICAWCIGVFCISVYSKGFAYYHLEFRMHRMMIILPVLFTTWVYIYNIYRQKIHVSIVLLCATIITITGMQNYTTIQLHRPISRQYQLLEWLHTHHVASTSTIYLLNATSPKNNLISIRDITQYFYPTLSIDSTYKLPIDCSPIEIHGIFLLQSNDVCASTLNHMVSIGKGLTFIGTFDAVPDEPLFVYQNLRSP